MEKTKQIFDNQRDMELLQDYRNKVDYPELARKYNTNEHDIRGRIQFLIALNSPV